MMQPPAKVIDHTLLKADCTTEDINALCEDAVEFGFAAVCVPPAYVHVVKERLYGSDVATCTVIGFPLGYQTVASKVFEAANAVELGASEIDMVINLGAARRGDFALVDDEIRRVIGAAGGALVKVIIECCLFDNKTKSELAVTALNAGADFVKTSTGFSSGGATLEDVALLQSVVAGKMGIKAAGGIRDWQTLQKMLAAGATRIGTSAGVSIVRQWQKSVGMT